ncbi:MAG: hypothetical protein EAZ24_13700 [Burkholderiales bacterium]|nr:MAG: hypothetical protein EAZ24_13700 [Burkholderiales bacterium]TAG77086.1 MAG: hypothetical protein EAZ21_15505 [Betaproteobacteria bacterium]
MRHSLASSATGCEKPTTSFCTLYTTLGGETREPVNVAGIDARGDCATKDTADRKTITAR